MLKFRKRSDLTGYTPEGARSRFEHDVYEEFFDHSGQGIQILMMIMAKDNGTMLRDDYLKETVEVSEEYLSQNIRYHFGLKLFVIKLIISLLQNKFASQHDLLLMKTT